MNNIVLSNGIEIPPIGLGTYPMHGETLTNAVLAAYTAGFRLIDTSDNYYNEKDLGESLTQLYAKTSATRKDLFLLTKLSDELYPLGTIGGTANRGIYFWKNSPAMQRPNAAREIIEQKVNNSLNWLKTDYIDALLMHWPYPDYFEEIWFEMERLYKKGVVLSIGVCNCRERHFEKLKKSCEIFPMINQFETSPINTKVSLLEYCNSHNIKAMIYSPLMSLRRNNLNNYQEFLKYLGDKYEKNPAQIILRFHIQRGTIPIPKSSNATRLQSNIDIFDFSLTEEEMKQLLNYNIDLAYLPESRTCPGL